MVIVFGFIYVVFFLFVFLFVIGLKVWILLEIEFGYRVELYNGENFD